MSDATRGERSTLNRRQLLRLRPQQDWARRRHAQRLERPEARRRPPDRPRRPATCSTPRTAMAKTQYGKVRGYLEDGVLTFKGVPYGATTGGENRWLPAKPPAPWDGEYPALIYGANCPQRLHDWVAEQTFLYQWTDGWQSEDMLKVNIWTPSLTGSRPVMVYLHGGGFTFGSAYELASQDGAQMARHHDVVSVTVNHRLNILGFLDLSEFGGPAYAESANVGMTDLVAALQWVRDQHRQLRRRPGPRDDLRSVRRRVEGDDAARHAVGAGADPSRVGAVGRWWQSAFGRAVPRAHEAADRRARCQGHGSAAEDGLGAVERRRHRRDRGHEPAAGPHGGADTASGFAAARGLGSHRRRPRRHDAVVLRRGAGDLHATCRC